MKIKKILVAYYVHNYKTLQLVEETLQNHRVKYTASPRIHLTRKMCAGKGLIIVVGGDGTFLRAAHHTDKTPILAVSSDTRYNEAFYAQASPKDFARKFKKILEGKYRIRKLPRLEAKIGGEKLPYLAVNEMFVGNKHPYHTSRYTLQVKGRKEFQKSSGILITTKAGSTGWAKSAAKKTLKIPKNGFGYVVREPYRGRLTKPKLLQGNLSAKEKIRITSSLHKGIVVIDSSEKTFKFTDGMKLEVGVSKKPLNYVEV